MSSLLAHVIWNVTREDGESLVQLVKGNRLLSQVRRECDDSQHYHKEYSNSNHQSTQSMIRGSLAISAATSRLNLSGRQENSALTTVKGTPSGCEDEHSCSCPSIDCTHGPSTSIRVAGSNIIVVYGLFSHSSSATAASLEPSMLFTLCRMIE